MDEHEVHEVLVTELGGFGVFKLRAPRPRRLRGLAAVVDAVGVVQVVVEREGHVERVHNLQATGMEVGRLLQLLHEDAVVDLHLVWVREAVAGVAGLVVGFPRARDGRPVHNCGKGVLPERVPEGDGVVDALLCELAGFLVEVRVVEAGVHHHGIGRARAVEVGREERAV